MLAFLSLALLTGTACDETEAAATPLPEPSLPVADGVPQGVRRLGIDVIDAENEEYDAAFNLARAAGMEVVSLSVYWDDIETAPGVFSPDPNWLEIANIYFPAQDVQVTLTIATIDTINLRLPADLRDKQFDDREVIARFNALLDYIAAQTPDLALAAVAIGNEIDGVLGTDPAAWEAYEGFFRETAAHARTLWPDVPVGSKVMWPGLTTYALPFARSLNDHSDAVLVTYYPFREGFAVADPAVVPENFAAVVEIYPDKPIFFLETGYPAGAANKSSEAQQAEFVRQVFQAWDNHSDQVEIVFFTWLTDMPAASVDEMTQYYGLADEGFVSYLATLGLRRADGTPKPAWEQLRAEAAARGWGDR